MWLLIGGQHFVSVIEIESVLRFTGKGSGSRAVQRVVDELLASDSKQIPHVFDLTGEKRRQSLVVMKTGRIYISPKSSSALHRQYKALLKGPTVLRANPQND